MRFHLKRAAAAEEPPDTVEAVVQANNYRTAVFIAHVINPRDEVTHVVHLVGYFEEFILLFVGELLDVSHRVGPLEQLFILAGEPFDCLDQRGIKVGLNEFLDGLCGLRCEVLLRHIGIGEILITGPFRATWAFRGFLHSPFRVFVGAHVA